MIITDVKFQFNKIEYNKIRKMKSGLGLGMQY